MIFFKELERSHATEPRNAIGRPSAQHKAMAGLKGLVGVYGDSDRGYLLKKSSNAYHFLHYEKGYYDELSEGFVTMEEALGRAYFDAEARGRTHLGTHWALVLQDYGDRLWSSELNG